MNLTRFSQFLKLNAVTVGNIEEMGERNGHEVAFFVQILDFDHQRLFASVHL